VGVIIHYEARLDGITGHQSPAGQMSPGLEGPAAREGGSPIYGWFSDESHAPRVFGTLLVKRPVHKIARVDVTDAPRPALNIQAEGGRRRKIVFLYNVADQLATDHRQDRDEKQDQHIATQHRLFHHHGLRQCGPGGRKLDRAAADRRFRIVLEIVLHRLGRKRDCINAARDVR
jgi:hypothetical protein